jgi:hypothetical protein
VVGHTEVRSGVGSEWRVICDHSSGIGRSDARR